MSFEVIIVLVLLVGVCGVGFYIMSKSDSSVEKTPETIEEVVEEITETVEEVVEEVREIVHNATKPKLQSDTHLKKKTKKQLDEYAKGFGIDLDRRLTKAKMIAELKKQYKNL